MTHLVVEQAVLEGELMTMAELIRSVATLFNTVSLYLTTWLTLRGSPVTHPLHTIMMTTATMKNPDDDPKSGLQEESEGGPLVLALLTYSGLAVTNPDQPGEPQSDMVKRILNQAKQ